MKAKALAGLAAAVAALAICSPAHAAPGSLVTCQPDRGDTYYGAYKIVTNQRTRCPFAQGFAETFQRVRLDGRSLHGTVYYTPYRGAQRYYFHLRGRR
jgi:hypothetical protein